MAGQGETTCEIVQISAGTTLEDLYSRCTTKREKEFLSAILARYAFGNIYKAVVKQGLASTLAEDSSGRSNASKASHSPTALAEKYSRAQHSLHGVGACEGSEGELCPISAPDGVLGDSIGGNRRRTGRDRARH